MRYNFLYSYSSDTHFKNKTYKLRTACIEMYRAGTLNSCGGLKGLPSTVQDAKTTG